VASAAPANLASTLPRRSPKSAGGAGGPRGQGARGGAGAHRSQLRADLLAGLVHDRVADVARRVLGRGCSAVEDCADLRRAARRRRGRAGAGPGARAGVVRRRRELPGAAAGEKGEGGRGGAGRRAAVQGRARRGGGGATGREQAQARGAACWAHLRRRHTGHVPALGERARAHVAASLHQAAPEEAARGTRQRRLRGEGAIRGGPAAAWGRGGGGTPVLGASDEARPRRPLQPIALPAQALSAPDPEHLPGRGCDGGEARERQREERGRGEANRWPHHLREVAWLRECQDVRNNRSKEYIRAQPARRAAQLSGRARSRTARTLYCHRSGRRDWRRSKWRQSAAPRARGDFDRHAARSPA
jgi:hypothetical protein